MGGGNQLAELCLLRVWKQSPESHHKSSSGHRNITPECQTICRVRSVVAPWTRRDGWETMEHADRNARDAERLRPISGHGIDATSLLASLDGSPGGRRDLDHS
jgi:hypothetical protein